MGCGNSSGQAPVLPVQAPAPAPTSSSPRPAIPKEQPANKPKKEMESSIRTTNNGSNKMTASKSVPKTNPVTSISPEKSAEKGLNSSKASTKQPKQKDRSSSTMKEQKPRTKSENKSLRDSTASLGNAAISPSKVKLDIHEVPEHADEQARQLRGTKSKKKKGVDPKLQEFMKIYGV